MQAHSQPCMEGHLEASKLGLHNRQETAQSVNFFWAIAFKSSHTTGFFLLIPAMTYNYLPCIYS